MPITSHPAARRRKHHERTRWPAVGLVLAFALAQSLSAASLPADVRQFLAHANAVYAATDSGLYQSNDTGRTWAIADPALPKAPAQVAASEGSVFAVVGSRAFRRQDGGSWTAVCQAGPAPSPCLPDSSTALSGFDSILFLKKKDSFYRSADQGKTWEPTQGPVSWGAWVKTRKSLFYYDRESPVVLYRSRDGGKTFPSNVRAPDLGMGYSPDGYLRLVTAIADSILSVCFQGSSPSVDTVERTECEISRDEGATWEPSKLGWKANKGTVDQEGEVYFLDHNMHLLRGWVESEARVYAREPPSGYEYTCLAFAYGRLLAARRGGEISVLDRAQWRHEAYAHRLTVRAACLYRCYDFSTQPHGDFWLDPGDTLAVTTAQGAGTSIIPCARSFSRWQVARGSLGISDSLARDITVTMGSVDDTLTPDYECATSLPSAPEASHPSAVWLGARGIRLSLPGVSMPSLPVEVTIADPMGRRERILGRARRIGEGTYAFTGDGSGRVPGPGAGIRFLTIRWPGGELHWVQALAGTAFGN